ncbi:MAG: hypothetical protein ACLFVO_18575 [Chloroflexaceae bacterium]
MTHVDTPHLHGRDAERARPRRHISAITGAEVAHLLQATLQTYPPGMPTAALAAAGQSRAQPLGRYLLAFGYLPPPQLVMALAAQRQLATQGVSRFLGDILVDHGVVDRYVMTTLLIVQLLDRLLDPTYAAPWRLGEYLVLTNRITPMQLAPALRVQAWLRQQGMVVHLGDLLVEQGVVHRADVTAALTAQAQQHTTRDAALLV